MVAIMASAAASQTTNAVADVASLTTRGITDAVYNYNPVEMFKSTAKTIQKAVSSKDSLPRSPSVVQLQAKGLRVHIIKLRNLRFANGSIPGTVKCLMRLDEGCLESGKEFYTDLVKTRALARNREDEIIFNESYNLEPLISLDMRFHFRVYEAGLLSNNVLVAEFSLAMRKSLLSDDVLVIGRERRSQLGFPCMERTPVRQRSSEK